MKVYGIALTRDGAVIPLTEAPANEIAEALTPAFTFEPGDADTEAEWDEQARIVLSLKRRGLLP